MPGSFSRVVHGPLFFLELLGLVAAMCGGLVPGAQAQDRHKDKGKKHVSVTKKKDAHRAAQVEGTPPPASLSTGTTEVDAKHVAQAPAPQETMQTRGPTRLDFDDRMVQGQGSKVGAVYLYDRKNLPLRSMVRKRENFRDQIGSDEVSGPVVE